MRREELVKLGGTKNGLVAAMLASVPPLLNPVTNEALAPAAVDCWLPATSGERNPGPTVNGLLTGGLFMKLSTTVAGNTSVNSPKPPRKTVSRPVPNGLHAKPKRGCQLMVS